MQVSALTRHPIVCHSFGQRVIKVAPPRSSPTVMMSQVPPVIKPPFLSWCDSQPKRLTAAPSSSLSKVASVHHIVRTHKGPELLSSAPRRPVIVEHHGVTQPGR